MKRPRRRVESNISVLAFLIAICALGRMAGCLGKPSGGSDSERKSPASCSGAMVQDNQKLVRSLLEKNRLSQLLPPPSLPQGEDWDRLSLQFFPNLVVVDWKYDSRLGQKNTINDFIIPRLWCSLIFRSDGQYICEAAEYRIGDVTGDGVNDLVTVELREGLFYFYVYPLGPHAPPARYLGSVPNAYSPPQLVDFNGDGIFEIVTKQNEPLVDPREQYDFFSDWTEEDARQGYLAVWSLKYGHPRQLLVLFGYLSFKIDLDSETGHPALLIPKHELWDKSGGMKYEDPRNWVEFKWDETNRQFKVPAADVLPAKGATIVVLRNQPMLR